MSNTQQLRIPGLICFERKPRQRKKRKYKKSPKNDNNFNTSSSCNFMQHIAEPPKKKRKLLQNINNSSQCYDLI